MDGEVEAVASIATGALVARAVEKEAGEAGPFASTQCANCQADLIGQFCQNCGQKGQVHRTLTAFWHDLLHSVLHFDGKVWRTLPLLALKPGELTRRYVHGERAKFVSPLALFLFTVFLTFALFGQFLSNGAGETNFNWIGNAKQELASETKQYQDDIKELVQDRKEAVADGAAVAWIDGEIARKKAAFLETKKNLRNDIAVAERNQAHISKEKSAVEAEIKAVEAQLSKARSEKAPPATLAQLEAKLAEAKTGLNIINAASKVIGSEEASSANFDINIFGIKRFNEAAKHAIENPQLLLYKVQTNAYKFAWALIPISVPFVWLLFFWKRRFHMYDHAVFVTYSLCFMLVLLPVSGLLIATGWEALGGMLLAFGPPAHMFVQLKGAYETTAFGAFWRMCVLCVFATIALTVFTTLILAMGFTS